jgi:hypothetical protein
MKRTFIIITFLVSVTSISFTNYISPDPVKDYLNVSGPIVFNGINYDLSWSSHPAGNFYKQEYIVKGDNPDKFKEMIMIDLVTGTDDIKAVLRAKVSEIEEIKKTNPVVRYEVIENKSEYMLDFLLSENTPDGKFIAIVERNVYRYKKIKDKSGKKGVLLFGISVRSYGDDIDGFFAKLKSSRYDLINTMGAFQIPDVTILE